MFLSFFLFVPMSGKLAGIRAISGSQAAVLSRCALCKTEYTVQEINFKTGDKNRNYFHEV
uniref:Uncharacterized protein n=1 Tax=Faecalibaculum rodentium TaxID=1702221 RepID=A0A140DTA6_9FIRM|nr:hypothetical protein AALO17_07490 [Faecalibaculum rodentium]